MRQPARSQRASAGGATGTTAGASSTGGVRHGSAVDVTAAHASADGAWLHVRPRGGGLPALRQVAVAVHGYRHALARPAPHRVTPSIDAGIVL